MNSDTTIPSVPIITLAGVGSLTNLLTELPLPQATPESRSVNKSLLFHPKVAEECKRLLNQSDPELVESLVKALSEARIGRREPIVLKDKYKTSGCVTAGLDAPPLLQAILRRDPHAFGGGPSEPSASTSTQDDMPGTSNGYTAMDIAMNDEDAKADSPALMLPPVDNATRKQIVSLGKQPKACRGGAAGGRRRNMVSELFDSLTPELSYFAGDRRRTTRTKKEEEALEGKPQQAQGEQTVGGRKFWKSEGRTPAKAASASSEESSEDEGQAPGVERAERENTEREKQWHEMLKKRAHRRRKLAQFTNVEEVVEHGSFKEFMEGVEQIFNDIGEYDMSGETTDDNDEIPPELIIQPAVLDDLSHHALTLKSISGAMHRVPADVLVKLITMLDKNVKDGMRVSMPSAHEAVDETDAVLNDIMSNRILRSADAALIILTIMTSDHMPKEVFIEDAIERAINFTRFQLNTHIYPAFDPLYKINTKDGTQKKHRGRPKATSKAGRFASKLYHKLVDIMSAFGELVELQQLTDSNILQLSSIGVAAFFVENVNELQLASLRLVTNIFSRYCKHHKLIIDDIVASLARLPSSKRGKRVYRLNADEYIQMITALVMQLVQCVVCLSPVQQEHQQGSQKKSKKGAAKSEEDAVDIAVSTSYQLAKKVANQFLTAYLGKCTTKGEDDYRKLFEDFVEDLLQSVNKPEWPAAETMLTLLGQMLAHYFASDKTDQSLRTASLDYLGVIAARLRKDACLPSDAQDRLERIVSTLLVDEASAVSAAAVVKDDKKLFPLLQSALISYLLDAAREDPLIEFSRRFYIGEWYVTLIKQLEKQIQTASSEKKAQKMLQHAEGVKEHLISLGDRTQGRSGKHAENAELSAEFAPFIVQYLASKRSFARSFETYLKKIITILDRDGAPAIRSKAMKALCAVVEADPGVLERPDMQRVVNERLCDSAPSVRDSAIELLGSFLLTRPTLMDKYMDKLSTRLLDKSTAVRKRVIKLLKDFSCNPQHAAHPSVTSLAVMALGQLSCTEDSVIKLVIEVFQSLWFASLDSLSSAKLPAALDERVLRITDVIMECTQTSGGAVDERSTLLGHVETLFKEILAPKAETQLSKESTRTAHQIVDYMMERLPELEAEAVSDAGKHKRLQAFLTALYLFSRAKPDILMQHAENLQPFLRMKATTNEEQAVLTQVIQILERVVPLMEHPSDSFLTSIEDMLLSFSLAGGKDILHSSLACLGAIVNGKTKNYTKIVQHFLKFLRFVKQGVKMTAELAATKTTFAVSFRRSIIIIGYLCRYFPNIDAECNKYLQQKPRADHQPPPPNVSILDEVFELFVGYITYTLDAMVPQTALKALGSLCLSNPKYWTKEQLTHQLKHILTSNSVDCEPLQDVILRDLNEYLREDETTMAERNAKWDQDTHQQDDLAEIGENASHSSGVIQNYLREVLDCYMRSSQTLRASAQAVILSTIKQGLVHPSQCIPHILAMCTDPDRSIADAAAKMLGDGGVGDVSSLIHMNALKGVQHSFRVQQLTHDPKLSPIVRGYRLDEEGFPVALNTYIYTRCRTVKANRRSLLRSLLKIFDDQNQDGGSVSVAQLQMQVYIADQLAHFHYTTNDEPLWLIHSIDLLVSCSGATLVANFKKRLLPSRRAMQLQQAGQPPMADDDEIDETAEHIYERVPANADVAELIRILDAGQSCVLLLTLKNYLQDVYSVTEAKVREYGTGGAAPGGWSEKPVTRRPGRPFDPRFTVHHIITAHQYGQMDYEMQKRSACKRFVDFKQLLESIDSGTPAAEEGDDRSTGTPSGSEGMQTPAETDWVTAQQHKINAQQQRAVAAVIKQRARATNMYADLMTPSTGGATRGSAGVSVAAASGGPAKRGPKKQTGGQAKRRKLARHTAEDSDDDPDYAG